MSTVLRQWIAGRWTDGQGELLQSCNPARPSEIVAEGATVGMSQVDAAVEAAESAAHPWARSPIHYRAAVLTRAADVLDRQAETWGAELTQEEGKTRAEGVGEVRRAGQILRYAASAAERATGQQFASPRSGERILVVRKPVGVVGVVTPWNFPIAIPAWKIAPALVHGNAVVWKPASLVPLLAMRLAQALEEGGLPPGVLALLIGPGKVGQRIIEHPGVDALSFTGSTEVGTSLMGACAAARKPVQTEMGGKNAAVVLADADCARAARDVVTAAMGSTGQKCTATSRLVVEEPVRDELLEQIEKRVTSLVVGDGLVEGVAMGPASSKGAARSIREHDRHAREAGARVVAEGACPGGDGYFVPPVVLELQDTDVPIWRDEVFGPVLAVTVAANSQDALRLANDSEFGLSGSLFTADLGAALDAIDEFDVGILHLNSESTGADPHVPFGGAKGSGYGPKEQGEAAMEFYTRSGTVYLKA